MRAKIHIGQQVQRLAFTQGGHDGFHAIFAPKQANVAKAAAALQNPFIHQLIGLVGVNTDTKIFFENNNLDIQYFFDNDKAGFDKSEEKIKENGKVFLWNKFFNWIIQNKSGDPYDLMNKITKVKDLNKLATIVQNPYKKLELEIFFSEDVYDLKWIPKSKKIARNFTKDYIKEFTWNNLEEL